MTAQMLDFTNVPDEPRVLDGLGTPLGPWRRGSGVGHPDALEHIAQGSWEGKPIEGVHHETDEDGEPVTILRVRSGNVTGSVVFDSFEDDEDGLS